MTSAFAEPRAAAPLVETVARMRAEFDGGFALSPPVASDAQVEYLAIRVGGDPCALRLADLLGVYVDRKVVPLPSSVPSLLGIASFRGALVPVHDLRLLLGYLRTAPAGKVRRSTLAGAPLTPALSSADGGEGDWLLGGSGSSALGSPALFARADARWLVRVRAAAPVGLAFDALEGQFRAAVEGGLVHALHALRPVIDLGGVLAKLGGCAAAAPIQEEG